MLVPYSRNSKHLDVEKLKMRRSSCNLFAVVVFFKNQSCMKQELIL